MNEVSIKFYAMPGSPHILQAPAHCATIFTTGDHPGPLKITGVFRNGAPLKFRALDDNTVAVSPPIRFEGGHHKGALRDAVQKQVHSLDLSGWRGLASRYLADMPPTLEAVKAGGYDTRQQGDRAEVFMDGRWITIAAAARLGML